MELIALIADLAGVIGMGFFLKAEIFQLWKILRTKMTVGISHTAYKDKLLAVCATSVMLYLSLLWLSLAAILIEGVIVIIILHLIRKHKERTIL